MSASLDKAGEIAVTEIAVTRAVATTAVATTAAEIAGKSVSQTTGTCFRAGGLSFTCTGQSLLEVLEVPEISPLGGTQPWFLGLVSYRAELLPVTDFAHWAGLAEIPATRNSFGLASQPGNSGRLLVVQRSSQENRQGQLDTNEKIALLVSDVSGQVAMDDRSIVETDAARVEASLRESLHAHLQNSQNSIVEKLMPVLSACWHSGEPVFVADLERLFFQESFLQVAAGQPPASSKPVEPAVTRKRAVPA